MHMEQSLKPDLLLRLGNCTLDTQKVAALEVTFIVRSLVDAGLTDKVICVLEQLQSNLVTHNRKGGLIGLAASTTGIGTENAELYLPYLIPPVITCFKDHDPCVSRFACGTLTDIVKVCRSKAHHYFSQIFETLCSVLTDLDAKVKKEAQLLFELMREVGAEVPADIYALADALRTNSTGPAFELLWCSVGDVGAVILAEALKVNTSVTSINLGGSEIGEEGASAFAEALAINSSIQYVNFGCTNVRDEGAVALAKALQQDSSIVKHVKLFMSKICCVGAVELAHALAKNMNIEDLNLGSNDIGDIGAAAFAQTLRSTSSITHFDVRHNHIREAGVAALAEALQVNCTVLYFSLEGNAFGSGLKCLADAIKDNTTVQYLYLGTVIAEDAEDIGALADALKVNKSVRYIDLRGTYSYYSVVESILEKDASFISRVTDCFVLDKLVKLGVVGCCMHGFIQPTGKYPAGVDVEGVLRVYGARFVQCSAFSRANHDGRYCAVAAAMKGDLDNALRCVRLWPERVDELLRERYGNSYSVFKSGLLFDIVQKESPESTILYGTPFAKYQLLYKKFPLSDLSGRQNIDFLMLVSHTIESTAALSPVNIHLCGEGTTALSPVNIHLCGEGYAGKTMTRQALRHTLGCGTFGRMLLPTCLKDIPLEEGRTLGMESEVVEFTGSDGALLRVLLHDYGGQLEFRANHAPYLSALNSVYVVVVPLWDKRPGHDRPYDLEEIVTTYTQWLKFLYTVVPRADENDSLRTTNATTLPILPKVVTVINFAKLCRPAFAQQVEGKLHQILEKFNASPGIQRLFFIDKPIVLDAIAPSEVHSLLAPELRRAIEELSKVSVPVSPLLRKLTNKAVKSHWPLFTTESQLKHLIKIAVFGPLVYGPSDKDITSSQLKARKVITTICEIAQDMMESRRDIVVFPVQHSRERISINRPNWLTNEVLGSLFESRAVSMCKKEDGAKDSHLLSIQDINDAVKGKLDSMTFEMIDRDNRFISKLLQHVGVCIPVVVDEGGLVRSVAEGEDAADVEHWFPAFSTMYMAETDGAVLSNANNIVARQFKLKDPEFSIFPPGYFSSLFVSIVSLYNMSTMIKIFKNGMVLESNSLPQIVVRQTVDENSFVVTVATVGPDRALAFQTMHDIIKRCICSESNWRGNVQVEEWCLHPLKLQEGPSYRVDKVVEWLRDPCKREEYSAFFSGLERGQPCLQQIILAFDAVLDKQEEIIREIDRLHSSVAAVRSVQTDSVYGVYQIPLLMYISQPPATSMKEKMERAVKEVYRVHFLCPCCGKLAPSGPNQHGYMLKATKKWVVRTAKVLRCALLVLQILSLPTPLPLPHLADLAQYLPGDLLGSTDFTDLLETINKFVPSTVKAVANNVQEKVGSVDLARARKAVSPAKEVVSAVVQGMEHLSLEDCDDRHIPEGLKNTALSAQLGSVNVQRPVITLEHVTYVLEVLQMVGDAAMPPNGHPRHTGLTRAVCPSKGQCAWVCQGDAGTDSVSPCKARYVVEGNDCLAVQVDFS